MSDFVNTKIEQFIKELGYELGVLGSCNYQLPENAVLVKPTWSPVDGSHTLVVTPHNVISLVRQTPYSYTSWVEHDRWGYMSKTHFLEILDRAINGCW